MDSDDQCAVCRIRSNGTPASLAADVEAPRVEWALKREVSIPASERIHLVHLARVAEEICL